MPAIRYPLLHWKAYRGLLQPGPVTEAALKASALEWVRRCEAAAVIQDFRVAARELGIYRESLPKIREGAKRAAALAAERG